MAKWLLGAVLGVVAAPLVLLVVGLRWNLMPVVNALRRFNKSVTNPRVAATAGAAGTQTSLIRHTGRTSGKTYETPVDVVPTASGFLIALPYGRRVDWLRNVLATGTATVVTTGVGVAVDSPRLVATQDVSELLPRSMRRVLRLFNVGECVHLERAAS